MRWVDAQAQLGAAARPVRSRMQQDAATAPVRLAQLIATIEKQLFDPDLTIKKAVAACGIRDKSISTQFSRQIGCAPRAYLIEARMETAANLLRDTSLPIYVIAELVCYRTASSFSNAFSKWGGQAPDAYRQQHSGPNRSTAVDPAFSSGELRNVVSGTAPAAQAERLVKRIQSLYAGQSRPPAAVGVSERSIVDGNAFERAQAQLLWDRLCDMPSDAQIVEVRDRVGFRSSALSDLLLTKSREHGRLDRAEGVRLVELALHHLSGNAELLGKQLPDLRAKALAHLGNAHRLALDFAAAEQAFAEAKAEWHLPREHPDPAVFAECLALQAALRVFQRRFGEALHLINDAIGRYRAVGEPKLLARSLIRRAMIHDINADHEAAIPDLQKAYELLDEGQDVYLDLAIATNLAISNAFAGRYDEAERALDHAHQSCQPARFSIERAQLTWITGVIHEGRHELTRAACCYASARHGFCAREAWGHAVAVSLYLAGAYARQGRMAEVLPLVAEILPLFEHFGAHPDALEARGLLRQALTTQHVELTMLVEARRLVDRMRRSS